MLLLYGAVFLLALRPFIPLLLVVYLRERDGNTDGVRDCAALFRPRERRALKELDASREVEE